VGWTPGRVRGWDRKKDLPPGEELIACFRPFLEDSVASDLSPKTIQKRVDGVWALGGEIIRDLKENRSLRRRSIEQLLGRAATTLVRLHLPQNHLPIPDEGN
jgi:hypothetical protein